MAKEQTTFELQEGVILKAEDIAKFLNISYSTFRKNSKSYWNLFDEYAKYEKVKAGQFKIIEVINPHFELEKAGKAKVKKAKEIEHTAFLTALDRTGRLTTVKEIIDVVEKDKLLIKDYTNKTISNKMYDSKKVLYGVDNDMSGEKGHTVQTWCKNTENGWVELEGEELKLWKDYISVFFNSKDIAADRATLDLDHECGFISTEKYTQQSKMLTNPAKTFPELYEKFKKDTGIQVQRRSMFIDHIKFEG